MKDEVQEVLLKVVDKEVKQVLGESNFHMLVCQSWYRGTIWYQDNPVGDTEKQLLGSFLVFFLENLQIWLQYFPSSLCK